MPDKFTFSAGATLPEIAEEVDNELAFITRYISPLLVELGFPGNMKVVESTEHDWGEDALLPNSATVNGAIGLAVTTIVVDTPEGLNFRLGDEVQIEGSTEIMLVVAPTPTGTNVEVTRGTKGTTAVDIADNAVLKRIGRPVLENAAAPDPRPTNRSRPSNYTQIFQDAAAVTRSMQKAKLLFGINDELDHQVDVIMKDLTRDYAFSVIRGKAQTANPEGTTTVTRTMNGIIHSILAGASPTVTDALGAGLNEAILNATLQDMWSKGGEPKLLAAPPAQRRRLSALLQGRQRFAPDDTQLGAVVERFVSDFGTLDVLAPDIFVPNNTIMILDPAKIRLVKLGSEGDPYEVSDLAKVGLTFRKEVAAEMGLQIKNAGDGGHALIQNLATT